MGRDGQRLRRAFQLCLEVAQAHYRGRAPQRKRGHPWVYGWDLYLALLLFRAYLRATYRETVAIHQALFADRPCPSFQSLHRFAKGVGEGDLRGLLEVLRERLLPLLPQGEASLLMDSSGLAHRSEGQRLQWRRGSQDRQVRGHSRLLLLARYYRGRGLLALEGVQQAGPTPLMWSWGSWPWLRPRVGGSSWPIRPSPLGPYGPLWRGRGWRPTYPSREGERPETGGALLPRSASTPLSTGCGRWWRACWGPLRPGSPVATSSRGCPPWPRSGLTWRPPPAALRLLLRLLLPPLLPQPPIPATLS